jgi:ATP phosphoribosyltransferase
MAEKLRLAIQKKGRLSEDSLSLVKESGISFSHSGGILKADAYNFPLEFLFLRDDDIPGYVADGTADIGIIGQNVFVEKAKKVEVIKELGFSKCRLSIGVPKLFDYTGPHSLDGKSIATSYPVILGKWMKENGIQADIHEISGSVEIAPSIGLADAVCDIVSTGSTLISNGLKEVEAIFHSQAVLVASPHLNAEKRALLDLLVFRFESVMRAKGKKYITLNCPATAVEKITNLIPGVKSPSITKLAKEGWVSMNSVVAENEFWDVIDKVRAAGAEGILVLPIEKIIE